jgi:hypothetical protein
MAAGDTGVNEDDVVSRLTAYDDARLGDAEASATLGAPAYDQFRRRLSARHRILVYHSSNLLSSPLG